MPTNHPRPRPPPITVEHHNHTQHGLGVDPPSDDDEHLLLSSPESVKGSPFIVPDTDELKQDIAELEQLRKSVQKNLRLRPIRSRPSLPKVRLAAPSPGVAPATSPQTIAQWSPDSDGVSSAATLYFTPLDSLRTPLSARPFSHIDPDGLADKLERRRRPLLIDTRPPPSYQASHIVHSINVSIPSLILKRCRKPGAGIQSLDALRQFITAETGKQDWDDMMRETSSWDGDIVVYDDDIDAGDTASALVQILIPLMSGGRIFPLLGGFNKSRHHPRLRRFIQDDLPVSSASSAASSSPPPPLYPPAAPAPKASAGLFKLNTQVATSTKPLPEIDTDPSPVYSPLRSPIAPGLCMLHDSSPSPPPSQITFKPKKIDNKLSHERLNGNAPILRLRTGMPTKAATLAVPPSARPPPSPSHLVLSHSNHNHTGHNNNNNNNITNNNNTLNHSPLHSPDIIDSYYASNSGPSTPQTPRQVINIPPSPHTARPEDQPPTTEEDPFPGFVVSCILPNFLFLGPEPQEPEHVKQLQTIGVKRILNLAIECEPDDHGLELRRVFEKYDKIPMKDTVEEDNITQGVKDVCRILDDARLHSSATYVHCKVGKSRSVTAVMAYLIHANHWTLSKAYGFVVERRKGISPNIGFVSELMAFEEQELGGKSTGVQSTNNNGDGADGDHSGGGAGGGGGGAGGGGGGMGGGFHGAMMMNGGRRGGGHQVRESLPPVFTHMNSEGANGPGGGVSLSAGGLRMGDSGQEMEIKDEDGRYRHARRAPVDEATLQPMRRVSKAGLESGSYQ